MTGTDTQGSGGSALLVVKHGTLAMPMESRVSVSDIPSSKRSEATEQVVEDVDMADNLSVDSDGSLVPSKSLTTVKPGANQVSTGKKTEVIGGRSNVLTYIWGESTSVSRIRWRTKRKYTQSHD